MANTTRQGALLDNSVIERIPCCIGLVCLHGKLSEISCSSATFHTFEMPTQCCVPYCNNKGGHTFPSSRPAVFQLWISAISRAKDEKHKFAEWKPTKWSVVCEAHFDSSDYVEKTTSGKIHYIFLSIRMI